MCAPVAQLDRAPVYGTEGWRFESSRACFLFFASWHGCVLLRENPDVSPADPDDVVHPGHDLLEPVSDELYMDLALRQARTAFDEDEVPVGAIVVHRGRVIAKAYNQREALSDPTAHAEMIAITQAAAARGSWRLDDCVLYVTLEPCAMCAGATVLARMARVVYGADDPKAGACRTLFRIADDPRLNHRAEIVSGVRADECGALLSEFFARKRRADA